MIPILYPPEETEFTSNGLGSLSDAISCTVAEERNGCYELEMSYPITGRHYQEIEAECYIFAVPAEGKDPQPFQIYRHTKPIDGQVTFYANHISYQLSGIPVRPFSANNPSDALQGLVDNSVEECRFNVYTDLQNEGNYILSLPSAFRECLGGSDSSILDIFGGEYEWDKYTVKLLASRGSDNGIKVVYGKNMTDLSQEYSLGATVTGIFPYWQDSSQETLITCPPVHVKNIHDYSIHRTIPYDMSSEFDEAPTVDELREAAQRIINNPEYGRPELSLDLSFINLADTEEYKGMASVQHVGLCDTITVEFKDLGVSTTAKVVRTEFDVLAGRFTSIEVGDVYNNLSNTIYSIEEISKAAVTQSDLNTTLAYQSELIRGGLGGHMIIERDADGHPSGIVIGNTDDINTMTSCVRINRQGIAFGSSYSGPYTTAWTLDGSFVGTMVGAGVIDGALIRANSVNADAFTAAGKEEFLSDISDQLVNVNTVLSSLSATQQALQGALSTTNQSLQNLQAYVRIQNDGIYLGAVNDPVSLVITKDQISFVDTASNQILGYFAQKKLTAAEIEVKSIYTLTTSEPINWATSYGRYYTRSGQAGSYVYTKVETYSPWHANTYFSKLQGKLSIGGYQVVTGNGIAFKWVG